MTYFPLCCIPFPSINLIYHPSESLLAISFPYSLTKVHSFGL